MTVRELIDKLLDIPMNADVAIVISNDFTDPEEEFGPGSELGVHDVVHRAYCSDIADDCQLVVVPSHYGIVPNISAIERALDDSTALVTLSHTIFKSGYTYDMAAVTELAHQAGALVLWDTSHSVGAIPIDFGQADVDLAVGCTYKYLNGGPGSPAFLYVKEALQDQIGNPISGWMGQLNP